jgi:hypothetical protein
MAHITADGAGNRYFKHATQILDTENVLGKNSIKVLCH